MQSDREREEKEMRGEMRGKRERKKEMRGDEIEREKKDRV